MKRHSVVRRCVFTAGLCLLLFGTLAVSLWWATTSSSLPVAALQARAGGEVASAATPAPPGEAASARAAQLVRSQAGRTAQDVSAKAAPPKPDAERAVQEAWERARVAGVYGFATELIQLAYPARSLANVGRGPDRVGMRMEGEIDQPARTLEFRLWQPGMTGAGGAGSAMTPGSGAEASAEARIEGDHTYVRPAGGDWKEVEDFSASFAPDNDPLAFLGGITNVRETPTEELLRGSRGADEQGSAARGAGENALTLHISRFTFQLDGPALATYLRDRLERQLTERGELPLGVTLEASSSFQQMTGSGELWVDARGLPLRLAMHLAFPEQRDGSHLEADIQTDFSGFPEELAAAPKFTEDPLAWADFLVTQSSFVDRESSIQGAAKAGGAGGALACSLGTIVLLLACRRSRRLYAAVVVAVILSMVVVPLMQSERAVAFFDRQAARSQDLMSLGASGQAINPENAQAADDVANYLSPSWNPQQDPLAQPDRAAPQVGDAPGLVSDSAGPTAPGGVFSEEAAAHVPANSRGPLAVTPTPTPTPDPCAQEGTTDPDNDGVNDHEECRVLPRLRQR